MVIGPQRDHAPQQALHLVHPVQLLFHHRLLVEQIGVVGEPLVGLGQQLAGLRPLPGFTQQLHLGQHLGSRIVVAALRRAPYQFHALGEPTLPGQQRGAPHLHLERALRRLHLVQPGFGAAEVALQLGRLGQHQPRLRQTTVGVLHDLLVIAGCCRGGWRLLRRDFGTGLDPIDEGLQCDRRLLGLPQFEVQCSQGQPRRGLRGIVPCDHFDLGQCVGVSLRHAQSACVEHADRVRLGLCFQVPHDDGFCLGSDRQHRQRQQHRVFCRRVLRMGTLRVLERTGVVTRREPGAADGYQRRGAGLGILDAGLQRRFDHFRHCLAVGGALEEAWQAGDQSRAFGSRRQLDQRTQRLRGFRCPIQRDQQLDQVAVCFSGGRKRGAPRLHDDQCLAAGADLQRHVGGALVQLFVLGLVGGVEHHQERRAALAGAEFQFADQQLIEQRCVEVRVVDGT